MIVVSACLAGKKCRYDGSAKPDDEVLRLVRDGKAVCACPEAMSGLRIPRPPAEIRGGDGFSVLRGEADVYNKEGKCVTQEFLNGARRFLACVQQNGAREVWLKAKSPSCGVEKIYDGTFKGLLRDGCGVTCALLIKHGIKVVEIH
jgi:uncharacterized protein YbbK (DUF523 family)